MASRKSPVASQADFAARLKDASARGASVRFTGGRTKLAWGSRGGEPDVELSTAGLNRIVEHNAGDLTAVLEAGVPLQVAQAKFAEAGQMLALDPPAAEPATIGGVVATADAGPLRSRYGAARDLVVGIAVALSDGTVAQAGGKVIKNVAGYDLAKLFTGSFGTLGAILELSVRLHPLAPATATAAAGSADPEALARGALALSHAPLEHSGLDVRFGGGDGAVLIRFAGAAPGAQAEGAARVLAGAGLVADVTEDDDEIWRVQREGQRSSDGTVVRVSALQTELAAVMAAGERLGARLVGRAPLGLCWLRIEDRSAEEMASAVERLRLELSPAPCVVLDAPAKVRVGVDPWGRRSSGELELMGRVRKRFDPAGSCNPGLLP